MARDEIIKVQIRIPRRFWDAAGDCAHSVAQSKNAFVVQAVAQRLKNWTDAITGEKIMATITVNKPYEGWMCGHSSHGLQPASDCRGSKATHKKEFYNESYPGLKWADYCQKEGITP